MERNTERSFCCGAGGARMWMEENIGERINVNRTVEAVGTGADQIAVGCPFCRVMLSDGLTAQQAKGEAREEVEVLDVAQMLLASVKGEMATKFAPGSGTAPVAAAAARRPPAGEVRLGRHAAGSDTDVATKAEPEAGDVTQTENTVTATEDTGPAAKVGRLLALRRRVIDVRRAGDHPGREAASPRRAKAAKPATSPAGRSSTSVATSRRRRRLRSSPLPREGRARQGGARPGLRRVAVRPRRWRARGAGSGSGSGSGQG